MDKLRPRRAFTLIEVLMVVVLIAVLAATLVPRFASTTEDCRDAALLHNLAILKSQIQVYRADHFGEYPSIQDQGLPQLTAATNRAGTMGDSGPDFPCGPYLLERPVNPYDGSAKVTSVAKLGQKPTAAVGSLGGWQYDESNGAVWPNHPEWYERSTWSLTEQSAEPITKQ